jgi:phosphinothricin acetyltransferase
MIRKVEIKDAKQIVDIYNYYILNTVITFEEEELTVAEMEKRIEEKTRTNPWIVYEEEGHILGYAYLGTFRERSAFRFTKESSIYLDKGASGKGIGSKLYKKLIKLAKEYNINVIVGVITLPNEASIAIHQNFGFERVGSIKEVGFKQNKWWDVDFWQKKVE